MSGQKIKTLPFSNFDEKDGFTWVTHFFPSLVFNGLRLLFPWAKVQSFETKVFFELDLALKMFVFRCGEETRIIPRILQVKDADVRAQVAGELNIYSVKIAPSAFNISSTQISS